MSTETAQPTPVVPTKDAEAKPADLVPPVAPAADATVPPIAAAVTPPAEGAKTVLTEPAKADPVKDVVPPAEKVVPEKYDIKLPEGSKIDPGALPKIEELAKAQGLSNEEAQKAVNNLSALAGQFQEQAAKSHEQVQAQNIENAKAGWLKQSQADPEIGGDKFNESVNYAKRALTKINDPELIKILNDSGLGNHPAVIRSYAKLGRQLADDKSVSGGDAISTGKSTAEVLYDHKE